MLKCSDDLFVDAMFAFDDADVVDAIIFFDDVKTFGVTDALYL